MNQYKDMRAFRQEYGEDITFKNVTIHGNADINEDLPGSLTVSLTPLCVKTPKKLEWHQ